MVTKAVLLVRNSVKNSMKKNHVWNFHWIRSFSSNNTPPETSWLFSENDLIRWKFRYLYNFKDWQWDQIATAYHGGNKEGIFFLTKINRWWIKRTTRTAEIDEARCCIPHSGVEFSTAVEVQIQNLGINLVWLRIWWKIKITK